MNRYEAVVRSIDRRGTCAWLSVGKALLAARPWPGLAPGRRVSILVRPEDVVLCARHPGRTSARNVLAAVVLSARAVPGGAAALLDAGFPLTALVTRRGARELGLRRGARVYALVKAAAVLPETPRGAAWRVSLAGPRGRIDPGRIDFLRTVERTGSLSAAARELGISYRTAWLWARAAGRAWGAPLVRTAPGGPGGGGAALTPSGRALLSLADAAERAAAESPPTASRASAGTPAGSPRRAPRSASPRRTRSGSRTRRT